jgi:hypothetical protein
MNLFTKQILIVGISSAFPVLCLEGDFRDMARCCPEPQGLFTAMQREGVRRYDHRNSLGFRDAEHGERTKPRLAVVGGSFAWGWGIERNQDRYGEQLAAMLGWDSVNASRWKTDTLQHIEFLKTIHSNSRSQRSV